MAEEPRKRLLLYSMDADDRTTGTVTAVGTTDSIVFDLVKDLPRIGAIWFTLDEIEKDTVCKGHRANICQNAGNEKGDAAAKMAVSIKAHQQIYGDRILKTRSAAETKYKESELERAAREAGIPAELYQAMMAKLTRK